MIKEYQRFVLSWYSSDVFYAQSLAMFRHPKSLQLSSSTPNPITFPSFESSIQTQSLTRRPVAELPRLTLSFVSESSNATDDDLPKKQKSDDIATFGDHHVV